MISQDALRRIIKLASEETQMRNLIIAMNGGYGGTKRRETLDDMAHILAELERELTGVKALDYSG